MATQITQTSWKRERELEWMEVACAYAFTTFAKAPYNCDIYVDLFSVLHSIDKLFDSDNSVLFGFDFIWWKASDYFDASMQNGIYRNVLRRR